MRQFDGLFWLSVLTGLAMLAVAAWHANRLAAEAELLDDRMRRSLRRAREAVVLMGAAALVGIGVQVGPWSPAAPVLVHLRTVMLSADAWALTTLFVTRRMRQAAELESKIAQEHRRWTLGTLDTLHVVGSAALAAAVAGTVGLALGDDLPLTIWLAPNVPWNVPGIIAQGGEFGVAGATLAAVLLAIPLDPPRSQPGAHVAAWIERHSVPFLAGCAVATALALLWTLIDQVG